MRKTWKLATVVLGLGAAGTALGTQSTRFALEEKYTAAFKARISLPGSLGPELTVKVQSLRVQPGAHSLSLADVDAALQPHGGPGWPENEIIVRLRRVGLGSDEGAATANGDGGQLGAAYNLYESVETVLLLADPRAMRAYRRQDAPGDQGDEQAECRRCDWPGYLPDPSGNDAELANIQELVAGHYVRMFLSVADDASPATRTATQAAIDFFAAKGENFPAPAGWADVRGAADAVASPMQIALQEPAQNAAIWDAGEAGVAVTLAGGELLVSANDYAVAGRAIPFALARTYRSGMLGYGPLGSAGWSSPLFAHLRDNSTTGEVEYHDGAGHVWRFIPKTLPVPRGYEEDNAGSYHVPEGVYLRLQKLSGGQGWRLVGREHDTALFDEQGHLIELADRHHRGGTAGEQGSRVRLQYDFFGQLVSVVDDLGRSYRFAYYEDPKPEAQGGDGPRYGLLKSVTDFVDRGVLYEYDAERRLVKVKLPEVTNSGDEYGNFSYTGAQRPTIEYRYAPQQGVDPSPTAVGAALHGEFAQLRLSEMVLPDFRGGTTPRVRFEYDRDSGKLASVALPTPTNENTSASSVEWAFTYPSADRATVRAPWGHVAEHTLAKGRTIALREELAVVRAGQAPTTETVTTSFAYTEDGRLLATTRPDGSRVSLCYADGENGEGCTGSGEAGIDRLSKANVIATAETALTPAAQGSASYAVIATGASYDGDNLVEQVQDGEARPIELAVANANASDTTRFAAEQVSAHFDYDRYGRVKESRGGGTGSSVARLGYGADARGQTGGGLVTRVERGEAFWQALQYDDAFNVKRIDTSQGAAAEVERDEWNRPVRTVAGLSVDGRLAQVGAAECAEGIGSVTEQAYDAAGHVVRERRLQDYVDPQDGSTKCRWVERRYQYNAREQVVAIEETHLASATIPSAVTPTPQTTQVFEYDAHGRLERERTKATTHADVVKTYSYDSAGRVASVQTGEEGARSLGYDERSRVVFATDGDTGTWLGRYDAWGRLFREEAATGAVTVREYDRAGNPVRERTYDGDPGQTATKLLAETASHVTSFGAVERVTETLTAAAGETAATVRVAEKVFDNSGRPIQIWSGPGLASDPSRVDRDRGRRDLILEYEPESGQLAKKRFGGDATAAPLYEEVYLYDPQSTSPWPDAVRLFESVPGQADLVETFTTSFRRDALGREIETKRSDGTSLSTVYDRTGGAIRARTGAGTESAASLDGRGLPIHAKRPNGRGFTSYGYDLDGSLLKEATATAQAQLWETSYTHDASGRVKTVTYSDGTNEALTYNADSTVQTRRARDGVLTTYAYDAANRLRSAIPSATASVVELDAGDALAYDELSRPTTLERGGDPAFAVHYSSYDQASRPASELVGARAPMAWSYDAWDRATSTTLPQGPGRGVGAFKGFSRAFDSLDRLNSAAGLGAAGLSPTALGATWTWGGANRLYAMNTRGALQTAARYGYHGGAGPQMPGNAPAGSEWKLGTLTWGSAGAASATSAPQTAWGSFGFGYRGNEGTPLDGAKIGRQVVSLAAASSDLFAGLGWSWQYDAGVRLASASAGEGDVLGRAPPASSGAESFHFGYGAGDELERIVREANGEIAEIETGQYGRILSFQGHAFTHDGAGRRTEDDRFRYTHNWRGELTSVTVKDTWPERDGDGAPETTPFAGHQIRYDRDALGRLLHRWHYGSLPAGVTDEAQRPFIEKRVYVWEGQSLLAEAAYGQEGTEASLRWRKTYVPGPSGLDDAVQVIVEDAASGIARTYTYLRDELGTVIGVVAEDEAGTPEKPSVPARYRFTPYGETHAESGPELLRVKHDEEKAAAKEGTAAGAVVTQAVGDERTAAGGALVLDWSLPLDALTFASGMIVEKRGGAGWAPLAPEEFVIGPEPESGGASSGGGGPPQLLVLTKNGWTRGTTYRVRLTTQLKDQVGRAFAEARTLEWRIPEAPLPGPIPAVNFELKISTKYESWQAASDTLGGRFPGGQTSLFQGAWTDPVTGLAYHRARWYDARTASWLSEDPLLDVDSTNLYAFVAWGPQSGTDPLGLKQGVPKLIPGSFFGKRLGATWDEATDSENSGVARAGAVALSVATAPAALGESIVRGVANFGYTADEGTDRAATRFAAAMQEASDPLEQAKLVSQGVGDIAFTAAEGIGYGTMASPAKLSPVMRWIGNAASKVNPLRWFDDLGEAASRGIQEGAEEGAAGLAPQFSASSAPSPSGVVYGGLDALGRPTGIQATITREMIGTGTDAAQAIRPPGFGGQAAGHARGHLLGKQLGGSGTDFRNLVTLYQNPANSPVMRGFENQVRAAVEAGQVVQYRVSPIYQGNGPLPVGITLEAQGAAGFRLNLSVLNQ